MIKKSFKEGSFFNNKKKILIENKYFSHIILLLIVFKKYAKRIKNTYNLMNW